MKFFIKQIQRMDDSTLKLYHRSQSVLFLTYVSFSCNNFTLLKSMCVVSITFLKSWVDEMINKSVVSLSH